MHGQGFRFLPVSFREGGTRSYSFCHSLRPPCLSPQEPPEPLVPLATLVSLLNQQTSIRIPMLFRPTVPVSFREGGTRSYSFCHSLRLPCLSPQEPLVPLELLAPLLF